MPKTLSQFLLDLRHEAHLNLPAERAEQIVTEVESHIADTANSLLSAGVSSTVAEAQAITRFGDLRRFIRSIENGLHETAFTRRVRWIGFWLISLIAAIGTMSLLYVEITYQTTRGFSDYNNQWIPPLAFYLIPFVFLFALAARRTQTVRYAWLAAVIAAMGFFFVGTKTWFVEYATHNYGASLVYKPDVSVVRKRMDGELADTHAKIAFYESGIKAFADSKAPIPESLKADGKYTFAFTDRFPNYSPYSRFTDPNVFQVNKGGKYFLATDYRPLAASQWAKNGGKERNRSKQWAAKIETYLSELNKVQATQSFNLRSAAEVGIALLLTLAGSLIAADFVGAWVGRRLWHAVRSTARRLAA